MPLVHNPIMIPGPAGPLEALVSPAITPEPLAIAIICHPHPLFAGTMHNKVVTTIARTFHELGLYTIRFNFRGVGESAGNYGAGIGETEDLLAVIAWARANFPGKTIWLAGFSFGCYPAMRAAAQEDDIAQLVTIAPAVNHLDFAEANGVHCPWLLIMGETDEVVPVSDVKAWIKTLSVPIHRVFLPGVSHFFHGQLTQLSEVLKRELAKHLIHK